MLHQGLILTAQREYAHAMRLGLLGLGDLQTRVDVELDALRAMQLLPQQYDLIVLDAMLDAMDGLQLLQLMKQQAPGVKFVVVSDVFDQTLRTQAHESGADLFLARPRTPESFKQALDGISALFKNEANDSAPAGEIEGPATRIVDVVQTHCLSGDTVLLLVRSKNQSGDIFIYQGAVLHAQYPGESGEDAFYDMCRWDHGFVRIKAQPLHHVPPSTIEISTQQLLEIASIRGSGSGQRPITGELRLVAPPALDAVKVPDVMLEAPPLHELWESPSLIAPGTSAPPAESGTALPRLNAHWKVNLTGQLVEGSQVSDPDRCAFITYFFYRKLADIAVALEVDYFDHMTLLGPHLQQVLVADNLGIRHAVFDTAWSSEADREQFVKWCCEQSF